MGRGGGILPKSLQNNFVWVFPVLWFEKMRLHCDVIRGSIGINGNEEEIAMSAATLSFGEGKTFTRHYHCMYTTKVNLCYIKTFWWGGWSMFQC